MYVWQRSRWPDLTWDERALASTVASAARRQGFLVGRMEAVGFRSREEAHLRTLTEDVVKTSEIEGEILDPEQVRSSIARRLGIDAAGLVPSDRDVEGVVEMMTDATGNHGAPLTVERLFAWHASLFPGGRSGMRKIVVGGWRDDRTGPMQVVSGAVGRERVHYEAPPASGVPDEIARFLDWFESPHDTDPILAAGLAHLWFVTIHPFDDGNGRIARAIADMVLSRAEPTRFRFYSMSSRIRHERKAYYAMLERTQKGDVDITDWQRWFVGCLSRAIDSATEVLGDVLRKSRFRVRLASVALNPRQSAMIERWLEDPDQAFTTSRWAKLAGCSQDTAHRDLRDLVRQGVVRKGDAGGRSTRYLLAEDDGSAI